MRNRHRWRRTEDRRMQKECEVVNRGRHCGVSPGTHVLLRWCSEKSIGVTKLVKCSAACACSPLACVGFLWVLAFVPVSKSMPLQCPQVWMSVWMHAMDWPYCLCVHCVPLQDKSLIKTNGWINNWNLYMLFSNCPILIIGVFGVQHTRNQSECHLPFPLRAGWENDNCIGLKLAKTLVPCLTLGLR